MTSALAGCPDSTPSLPHSEMVELVPVGMPVTSLNGSTTIPRGRPSHLVSELSPLQSPPTPEVTSGTGCWTCVSRL
jgi:hypothetical protein